MRKEEIRTASIIAIKQWADYQNEELLSTNLDKIKGLVASEITVDTVPDRELNGPISKVWRKTLGAYDICQDVWSEVLSYKERGYSIRTKITGGTIISEGNMNLEMILTKDRVKIGTTTFRNDGFDPLYYGFDEKNMHNGFVVVPEPEEYVAYFKDNDATSMHTKAELLTYIDLHSA